MAYLNSNQPYQRVDNGIGAGLMVGGAIGAATHYGTNFFLGKKAMGNLSADDIEAIGKHVEDTFLNPALNEGLSMKESYKLGKQAQNYAKAKAIEAMPDGIAKKIYKHGYGTGKRATITGLAATALGAAIGGAIDSHN